LTIATPLDAIFPSSYIFDISHGLSEYFC